MIIVKMSMHVSTCAAYDFSALSPVVWKLCCWYVSMSQKCV